MKFKPGETNIICRDAAASLAFYQDILGFTLVEREGDAIRLENEGVVFLLLPFARAKRPRWEYVTTPDFSLDLMVDDLAQAYGYLEAKGVTFSKPWSPGDYSFVIQDPDGLCMEVIGL